MINIQTIKKNLIIIIFIIIFFILWNYQEKEYLEIVDYYNIPIIVINFNNLYFIKNFINQLEKYKNPIIILDNNSNFEELLKYYDEIKEKLGDRIEIHRLDKNYGHNVYLQLADKLPDVYILSDPDLELNKNMPENFAEILYNLSNKYKVYKVGSALNIEDKDKFIKCENYTHGINIYDWEKQFWKKKIKVYPFVDIEYELYKAPLDTTFSLINNKYKTFDKYNGIRIAGNFTARHLPWYENYIKNNISKEEIEYWKKNNISSSILSTCLKL
jgi:hypothetical protein